MDAFFSKDDLMDITSLLEYMRGRTSAEIVVRITSDQVMMERTAREEFSRLGLDGSDESEALLLCVNLFHRKFVLLPGKKVLEALGTDNLRDHLDRMSDRFRKYQFGFGLHDFLSAVGNELSKKLPPKSDQK